jgi:hypothetical protein
MGTNPTRAQNFCHQGVEGKESGNTITSRSRHAKATKLSSVLPRTDMDVASTRAAVTEFLRLVTVSCGGRQAEGLHSAYHYPPQPTRIMSSSRQELVDHRWRSLKKPLLSEQSAMSLPQGGPTKRYRAADQPAVRCRVQHPVIADDYKWTGPLAPVVVAFHSDCCYAVDSATVLPIIGVLSLDATVNIFLREKYRVYRLVVPGSGGRPEARTFWSR